MGLHEMSFLLVACSGTSEECNQFVLGLSQIVHSSWASLNVTLFLMKDVSMKESFIEWPLKPNVHLHAKSFQLCPTLFNPWTVAHQAPLSMGFSRQNTGVGCHALL